MKTRIESVWVELELQGGAASLSADEFRLQRVDDSAKFNIYGGLDSSGQKMLAVGIKARPLAVEMKTDALDYFRKQRTDHSWLMVLRLTKPNIEVVFSRLCQDLIDASVSLESDDALASLFQTRLRLWQRLFGRIGDGILSDSEVRGLVAELLVLDALIDSGDRSAHETVTAWIGPMGADQDFLFSNSALEVKAIGPNADVVTISSLQQLDCSVPLELVLVTLRSASGTEANVFDLNSLVLKIESRLSNDSDALNQLKLKLLEAGYVENEAYSATKFERTKLERINVGVGFPRLTIRMVPAGLLAATYLVDLTFIRNLGGSAHG